MNTPSPSGQAGHEARRFELEPSSPIEACEQRLAALERQVVRLFGELSSKRATIARLKIETSALKRSVADLEARESTRGLADRLVAARGGLSALGTDITVMFNPQL